MDQVLLRTIRSALNTPFVEPVITTLNGGLGSTCLPFLDADARLCNVRLPSVHMNPRLWINILESNRHSWRCNFSRTMDPAQSLVQDHNNHIMHKREKAEPHAIWLWLCRPEDLRIDEGTRNLLPTDDWVSLELLLWEQREFMLLVLTMNIIGKQPAKYPIHI